MDSLRDIISQSQSGTSPAAKSPTKVAKGVRFDDEEMAETQTQTQSQLIFSAPVQEETEEEKEEEASEEEEVRHGIEEKEFKAMFPVYSAGHPNPIKIQWKYRNWTDERLEKSGDERAKIYKRNRDFGLLVDFEKYAEEDPVFRATFIDDRNKRIMKGQGMPGEKLEPVDVAAHDEGKYVDGLNSYLFFPGPDVDIITGRAKNAAHAAELDLRTL